MLLLRRNLMIVNVYILPRKTPQYKVSFVQSFEEKSCRERKKGGRGRSLATGAASTVAAAAAAVAAAAAAAAAVTGLSSVTDLFLEEVQETCDQREARFFRSKSFFG